MIIAEDELRSFLSARHATPHDRLGMHEVVKDSKVTGIVIRSYLPNTKSCRVVNLESGETFEMSKLDNSGFFEIFLKQKLFSYKFVRTTYQGNVVPQHDPYSFFSTISSFDCHLFGQGNHLRIFDKLGSHFLTIHGVNGVAFSVWAPNAKRVSVVGDFNDWDGRYHPMRMLDKSGIWELFIPEIKNLSKYKFEMIDANGCFSLKTDPYGNYFESSPNNAAIVFDSSGYKWNDTDWMKKRKITNWHNSPISIYEVHLDSWMRITEECNRPLTYVEAGENLVKYVKNMGFTHVEFMPLAEYPFLGSWGYQVTGFFAPTHRYGTPIDFMRLVDTLHSHNIGVIIDWVPAHFPKDRFALAEFDGTRLYEHDDPRQGSHEEWGTLIFNYGRHEVKNFLLGSLIFWFEKFHIDGIRVDAVSSMLYLNYSRKDGDWIPNQYGGRENIEAIEFLRGMNDVIHEKFPGVITIAEEATSFSGITRPTKYHGLGFDFKWNMGWMHDTLSYFSKDPMYRKYCHNQLTFAMLYQYSENFISAISHDEVVYGKRSMLQKMPGSTISEKARHLMVLYSYMWFWPGKKSLFMGCEFGQSDEWQYYQSLDWHLLQNHDDRNRDHENVKNLICDLNKIYSKYSCLYESDMDSRGFEWISCDDCNNSVIAFIRSNVGKDPILVVCNFTPVERENYRIGVPKCGFWKEIFNSDCDRYGGSNRGNFGGKFADSEEFHWRPYCLDLYLPPLSVICLTQRESPWILPASPVMYGIREGTSPFALKPGAFHLTLPASSVTLQKYLVLENFQRQ